MTTNQLRRSDSCIKAGLSALATAALLAVAGCAAPGAPSASTPALTAETSMPSAPTTVSGAAPTPMTMAPRATATPPVEPGVVSAARARLQAYLDAWTRDGCAPAAAAYLAPDLQLPASATGPTLSRGRVLDATVWDWRSSDDFVLSVELDLHFRGDAGAWNDGANSRFVTFSRAAGGSSWVMSFATSP